MLGASRSTSSPDGCDSGNSRAIGLWATGRPDHRHPAAGHGHGAFAAAVVPVATTKVLFNNPCFICVQSVALPLSGRGVAGGSGVGCSNFKIGGLIDGLDRLNIAPILKFEHPTPAGAARTSVHGQVVGTWLALRLKPKPREPAKRRLAVAACGVVHRPGRHRDELGGVVEAGRDAGRQDRRRSVICLGACIKNPRNPQKCPFRHLHLPIALLVLRVVSAENVFQNSPYQRLKCVLSHPPLVPHLRMFPWLL